MKCYVCRFAQHWEDFRLPELDATAKIQNVHISYDSKDYTNEVKLLFNATPPSYLFPFIEPLLESER